MGTQLEQRENWVKDLVISMHNSYNRFVFVKLILEPAALKLLVLI